MRTRIYLHHVTAFRLQTLQKLLRGVGLPWLVTVRLLLRKAGRNGYDKHLFSLRRGSLDLTGLTLFYQSVLYAWKILTFERDSTPRMWAFEEPPFETSFFPSRLLSSGTLRSKMREAGCVKLGHLMQLSVASLVENLVIRSKRLALRLKEETRASLPDSIRAFAVNSTLFDQ